jgi:hypothetical protein
MLPSALSESQEVQSRIVIQRKAGIAPISKTTTRPGIGERIRTKGAGRHNMHRARTNRNLRYFALDFTCGPLLAIRFLLIRLHILLSRLLG